MWDKFGIKTTWFVPAHSIESFPEQLIKVRDAGHEMWFSSFPFRISVMSLTVPVSGLHGYTHEFVRTLSEEQERDVLVKSINVLTKFLGKKPKGWTAPAWDTSRNTIRLLEEHGIVSLGSCGRMYLE